MHLSKITKDQALKILKAAIYVGVSAIAAYLITVVTDQPELFGPLTPIINIILVTIKQAFTDTK